MAEEKEVSLSGEVGTKHKRRFQLVSLVCFMIGIWLMLFPVYDFPFKDTTMDRVVFDILALVVGLIFMAIGFSLWRGGVS